MKKRVLAFVVVLAVLSSFCVGVMAADQVREITAQINYALKMKVDNVEWNPTEEDGSAIRPISYNGRTYLPVRALAEKLGIAIDWDEATQTVLIGEKERTALTADMVSGFAVSFTKDPDALYNGSGVYGSGIVVGKEWVTNQFSNGNIKLNGKYQTMTGSVYVQGGDKTIVFEDADTKEVYKSVAVKAGQKVDFEISVNGANTVRFSWGGDKATGIVLGDIYLK